MLHYQNLVHWTTAHSNLISVVGALIIFFSWVITNTFGQRYTRVKAATESAQSTFRLYTTLHEQRNQLNSLAMEVIQRSEAGMGASIFSAGKTTNPVLNEARKQFSRDRLSAHQISELMDFTSEVNALSRAVGNETLTSQAIRQILRDVDPIYQKLRTLETGAEVAINDPDRSPEEVMRAVEAYSNYFRLEALPKVPALYQRIVEASNARNREADSRLASAKLLAERSESFAIWIYAIGSILALTGQVVEKTKPKEVPIQAISAPQDNIPPKSTPDSATRSTRK